MLELPLPNDLTPHGIVIASCWQNDCEEDGPIFALLLVLHPVPSYYGVYVITAKEDRWEYNLLETHANINPATAGYADAGGDF
jgi:hypothetical protein